MNKRSGSESKRRIIVAARKVFSEYGYKGACMRMIAKESGVSLGGLYLYFKGKEDLYGKLLKGRLDDLAHSTSETVRNIKDPAGALRAFVSMRLAYARKHKELILLQGKEHGFTFGIKAKRQFFRHQREIVEAIIRRGIASGQFRECDVEEVSKVIVCALRGFILSIIVEPEALFSPETCTNLILNGLMPGERENTTGKASALSSMNTAGNARRGRRQVAERSGRINVG